MRPLRPVVRLCSTRRLPLDQQLQAPLALPFIDFQPKRQPRACRQRLGVAEPHAVHRLALVAQLERQVFFAHQALAQYHQLLAEHGRGKALAPYGLLQRVGHVQAAVLGRQRAVGGQALGQGGGVQPFGGDLLQPAYTASFLILAVVSLIAAGVLLGVSVPRSADTPQEKSAARSLGEIVRQPTYLVALFSAVTGYGVMILAMTATPLAMTEYDHGMGETATTFLATGALTGEAFGLVEERARRGEAIPLHMHDDVESFYVLEGAVSFFLSDQPGRRVTAGAFVHIPQGTVHGFRIESEVARLLSEEKLVGWMQGRAEFGPRALGNRSILADPRPAGMKDKINSLVKFREEFRPFAPSILHEYGDRFFENYQDSPYMERTLRFREEVKQLVPAVVHVNGTGRLQSVTKERNERYFKLIDCFRELTGVPVVLNTSLNVMGKPIAHSVEDALTLFYTAGLDALAIGDYLIEK